MFMSTNLIQNWNFPNFLRRTKNLSPYFTSHFKANDMFCMSHPSSDQDWLRLYQLRLMLCLYYLLSSFVKASSLSLYVSWQLSWSFQIHKFHNFRYKIYKFIINIYIYIYVCVCVCVCVYIYIIYIYIYVCIHHISVCSSVDLRNNFACIYQY